MPNIAYLHFRHTLSDFPLPLKPQNGITPLPFMHNHYGGDCTALPLPLGFWFLPVLPWKQCAVKNKISQTTAKSPATKQHNQSKTIPKTLISDLEKGNHTLNFTFCSYTANRFQTWRKCVFFNTKQLWWEVRMAPYNSQHPPPPCFETKNISTLTDITCRFVWWHRFLWTRILPLFLFAFARWSCQGRRFGLLAGALLDFSCLFFLLLLLPHNNILISFLDFRCFLFLWTLPLDNIQLFWFQPILPFQPLVQSINNLIIINNSYKALFFNQS